MWPPHIVVVKSHNWRSTRRAEVCCTYWRADSEVCTYWRAAASEGILPSPHQLLHSWLSLMTRQKRRLFAFLCQCVMTVKKNSHIIFNWESVSLLFCLMTVGEKLTSWFSTETLHTLWQVIITTSHILSRLYASTQILTERVCLVFSAELRFHDKSLWRLRQCVSSRFSSICGFSSSVV